MDEQSGESEEAEVTDEGIGDSEMEELVPLMSMFGSWFILILSIGQTRKSVRGQRLRSQEETRVQQLLR